MFLESCPFLVGCRIYWHIVVHSIPIVFPYVFCICMVSSTFYRTKFKLVVLGFPGGTVVKNPPTNAGDTGSSPGLGRSHMPRSS